MTTTAPGITVAQAYETCEEITRTEAKNFSYGIRLLPTDKRRALSAVYALARRIDDIGDGTDTPELKLAALEDVRGRLAGPPPGDDPVLIALHDAARRYPIPLGAFDELIDGCTMDASGHPYATFGDLERYCRLVAGSIGRLSLGVFGTGDLATAAPLADDLGVALQVTNILRDIVEDREQLGRVYLPADDIGRFGCAPDLTGPADAVAALVVFEARRARGYFATGLRLLPLLDRRSRACVGAMAGIYKRLLDRIEREPESVMHTRVSLPTTEKLRVALRSLAGAAP